MSEAFFQLRIFFKDPTYRDYAIEFINGTGPTFEEEVALPYRDLFNACESIDIPEEIEPFGENGLTLSFDLFGAEAIFMAETYMELCQSEGILKGYGYFADDEETELAWLIYKNKRKAIYRRSPDASLDNMLMNVEQNKRLQAIIELFEDGKLKQT